MNSISDIQTERKENIKGIDKDQRTNVNQKVKHRFIHKVWLHLHALLES